MRIDLINQLFLKIIGMSTVNNTIMGSMNNWGKHNHKIIA